MCVTVLFTYAAGLSVTRGQTEKPGIQSDRGRGRKSSVPPASHRFPAAYRSLIEASQWLQAAPENMLGDYAKVQISAAQVTHRALRNKYYCLPNTFTPITVHVVTTGPLNPPAVHTEIPAGYEIESQAEIYTGTDAYCTRQEGALEPEGSLAPPQP
ncbi:hypothetical protein Bbelb_184370 [Branchiostoma belcheri]|nr:hypothetical protein Bbelb_184370 [Branchiostoma belcheri]